MREAADGTASDKRLVVDVADDGKQGRGEGVRVDREGLVYVPCPGGICVVDPVAGKVIERLATPKRATNLAWGGPEAVRSLHHRAERYVPRENPRLGHGIVEPAPEHFPAILTDPDGAELGTGQGERSERCSAA